MLFSVRIQTWKITWKIFYSLYFLLAFLLQNCLNTRTPEAKKIPDTHYLWWTKISTDIFSRTCNLSTISEGQIINNSNFLVPKSTTRAISLLVMVQEALCPNPCPTWILASLGLQVDLGPDSSPCLARWLLSGSRVLLLFSATHSGGP